MNTIRLGSSHLGNIHLGSIQDVPVIHVRHPKATADISLFGGQVLRFQPTHSHQRLWLGEKAIFNHSTAIRGGIPLCWPWFGNHKPGPDPLSQPAHGFARQSLWDLDHSESDEQEARLRLSLSANEHTLSLWPHHFELQLDIIIGESLTLALTSKNTGTKPWSYTGAFHSYFATDDIRQSELRGLGRPYLDSVDNGSPCNGNGTLAFAKTLDHVYTAPETNCVLSLPQGTTQIAATGHDSLVAWSPWREGAAVMADLADDDYLRMFCVEPAVFQQPVCLQPGEEHVLRMAIS